MIDAGYLLVIRRRLCGCIVAAAVPCTAPARELERVFGADSDYRVVPLAGRPPVVRCPHEGSPYYERTPMTARTPRENDRKAAAL